MDNEPWIVTRHAAVRAALADPHVAVPPVPDTASPSGIDWLRVSVARFSTGATHQRRRALATRRLAYVEAKTLYERAFTRTAALLHESKGRPFDVMSRVARVVPIGLLAEGLDMVDASGHAVAVAARHYPPRADADPAADRAVSHLVDTCGGVPDEATAARIGLLLQAYGAMAGLIGNAAWAMLRLDLGSPAEMVLAETLRHDPPVRATRRLAVNATHTGDTDIAPGTNIYLDIAAANRDPEEFPDPERFDPTRGGSDRHLTFGFGPHTCPGRDHALAIAGGILEAVRGCRLITENVEYEPTANLRVPAALEVRPR